ncbi:MAG: hypothetical protein JRC91_08910, partial [Deltaproteobacteria bacterium]|nr:hypothetical protein [Deltaproteobacteria bacterium]
SLSDKIQSPEIISIPEKMNQYCSLLKQAQEKAQLLYERWEYLDEKKTKITL